MLSLKRISQSLISSRTRIRISPRFFFSSSKQNEPSNKVEEQSTAQPPEEQETSSSQQANSSSSSPNGQSSSTNAELEQKMRSLQDAYLETLANMENLRSRTKKEVENASLFAVQKFSKDILSVADTLEIAIESIIQSQKPDSSALLEGVQMTLTQLLAVLKRNGIEAFNPLHEKFDPNLQNALYEIPTGEYEPGIVLKVEKKGYLLHQRLLRPASVGISKAP